MKVCPRCLGKTEDDEIIEDAKKEDEAGCHVRLSDTAPYAANPCQELTAPESVDFAKAVMGRLQD